MTYALVAIVKDEAARIRAMLESVRPLISSWTVLDTGSTDGTPDVVRQGLAGIPGELLEEPFVDFGTTRSRAFAAARGTADWLIAADADMVWSIDPAFAPAGDVDAYMIDMANGGSISWRLPLLLAGELGWESRGAVHEYTCLADGGLGRRVATDQVTVRMPAADHGSPEKLRWHAELLERALERDPDDPRTVFYLAQTYWDLREWKALELYERRVGMGGWHEEVFWSRYRIASLVPTSAAKRHALLEAWESRPWRLEPLYDLVAMLNADGHHHAAYQLSSAPRPPHDDILFVHRAVWDWGLDFERSIAAWWVGDRALATALGQELLKNPRLPGAERLAVQRNLALELAA